VSTSQGSLQQFRLALLILETIAFGLAYWLAEPFWSTDVLVILVAIHWCSWPVWRGVEQRAFAARAISLALLFDLLLLHLCLWVAGAVGTALIPLLLLPVAVAALLLPAKAAWLIAITTSIGSWLLLQLSTSFSTHVGFTLHHQWPGSQPLQSHLWQMNLAFQGAVVMLTWFISRQARLTRNAHQQVLTLRQQQLQQQQLLTLATYAAHAAHELATPLQNLKWLSDELDEAAGAEAEVQQEIRRQIECCQTIVEQLRQNAQHIRQPQPASALVDSLQQACALWQVSRPDIEIQWHQSGEPCKLLLSDPFSLHAALFQILENAADAGLSQQQPTLCLTLQTLPQSACLQIHDAGPGLSDALLHQLGQQLVDSEQGLGIGQFIADNSIVRLGGRVTRLNHPKGGLITRIWFGG